MYEKAACKNLVNNTPLVNSTTFYEQLLCRYSFTNKFLNQTAIREKLQKNTFIPRSCLQNVGEIDTLDQFQHHFFEKHKKD
jgi:hypothetical protein